MLSGGSSVSWSVTWLAMTVTVHDSLAPKLVAGSRVKVVGPPLTVAVWAPVFTHEIVNQVPVTLTGSLKLMVMLVSRAIFTAPGAGVVLETRGASHGFSGEVVLRGLGGQRKSRCCCCRYRCRRCPRA